MTTLDPTPSADPDNARTPGIDADPSIDPVAETTGGSTGDPAIDPATAAQRRRRTMLAATAAIVPILVAVVAVIALSGLGGGGGGGETGPVPVGRTYTYLIPDGTAEKMRNNQFVADILPEYVSLAVGDRIVVENQDSETHTFGPITVRANETTSVDFINPGLYFGLCTVGTHDSITIQVT